jgi:DNA-binding HxlR family transcriptional regulator
MSSPDVMSSLCASRTYMSLIASKWSLLVINALGDEPRRNGELMRAIDGVSQKMLTQTLKQLEAMCLVVRRDHGTNPPHVTYELSPLGKSLRKEVRPFIAWIETHMPELRGRPPRQGR